MRRISFLALRLVAGTARAQSPAVSDWGYYGGDGFAQRYSPLREINRDNVAQLKPAWRTHLARPHAGRSTWSAAATVHSTPASRPTPNGASWHTAPARAQRPCVAAAR